MKFIFKDQSGAALAMTLIVMIVLTIIGGAFLRMSVADNKFALINENKAQAYYIARSGTHALAEYILRTDEIDEHLNNILNKSSEEIGVLGGKMVSVISEVNSSTIRVTTLGSYNGVTQESIVELTKSPTGWGPFENALFASESISGNNNMNIDILGDVASNGNIGFTVNNNSSNASFIGSKNENLSPALPLPSIVYPDSFDQTFNQSMITTIDSNSISNVLVNLTSNLTISENISIQGDSKTNLFIELGGHTLTLNGNINVSKDSQLHIYLIGEGVFKFKGSSTQNGYIFIYGKDATVEWSNSSGNNKTYVKGSVIAKHIKLHNHVSINYDTSVKSEILYSIDAIDFAVYGVRYDSYRWIR